MTFFKWFGTDVILGDYKVVLSASGALFLAAMSSSRTDVVTQFIRPFVHPLVMKEFFFGLRSYISS